MHVYDSLTQTVGNTPLIRLREVTRDLHLAGPGPDVLAKVEYFNPGGSVKDRIALRMIQSAEKAGLLQPGGTIVEPTSGNTGVGLAIVAAERGYKCVFICPDKVAQDKISVLRAYGADVVVCPSSVPPTTPTPTTAWPAGWRPSCRERGSLTSTPTPTTRPRTTPRPGRSSGPRPTGGLPISWPGSAPAAISGAGRYLKEISDGRVQVIGADPEGSVYSGGSGRPYLVEGVGEDIWLATYDREICDEVIAVTDAESFLMTRRLARQEALLVGGSSGLAVAAALKAAHRGGPGRGDRGPAPRRWPRLPVQDLQRRLDGGLRVPVLSVRRTAGQRRAGPQQAGDPGVRARAPGRRWPRPSRCCGSTTCPSCRW